MDYDSSDINHTNEQPQTETLAGKAKLWLKRLGVGGFLFFLIKGVVLYIVLPYLIAKGFWK